jgi:hypothetical protein
MSQSVSSTAGSGVTPDQSIAELNQAFATATATAAKVLAISTEGNAALGALNSKPQG